MRWFFRRFWLPFYRLWALRYVRRQRTYDCEGLHLQVPPGVFHPGIYFSTPLFLKFLKSVDFHGKKVLDIGTGSGLLALFAAKRGAEATALDIHPDAVKTAAGNAAANGLPLTAITSDLLDDLPSQYFDLILINPPFYPLAPQDAAGHAFYAGENLEYFQRLFQQLPTVCHAGTQIWMILSEDCDLRKIQDLAALNHLPMTTAAIPKKWGERFPIFVIRNS